MAQNLDLFDFDSKIIIYETAWIYFLFSIMLLGCAQIANAQAIISGRILDVEQNPIAGVNCLLLNLPDSTQIAGTTSDMEGRFELTVKEAKEYILQLSCMGYEKKHQVCKPGNLGRYYSER